MVPANRRKSPPLSQRLQQEPGEFDFFQAVRLLEAISRERYPDQPYRQRLGIGQDASPLREAVRFRALPSLSFPAAAIHSLRHPRPRPQEEEWELPPPDMVVSFLGLTGPHGVLPRHYSTLLIERIRSKDFSLRDFFDLFNHRVISLFYRAWEKYRFVIGYERAKHAPPPSADDLFTTCLHCIVGQGTAGLRGRMEVDDEAFLYFAGHFAHFPRCAVSLECLLRDYFALPVEVDQFLGQWLYLSPGDQSRLASVERPLGLNCQLGVDVIVGERVWDVQSRFRVRLGPLGYREFRRFLPVGDGLRPLCQLVRTYVGPELDFDVQPVLRGAEAPWCQLGGDGSDPACLGWNTWVRSSPLERDLDDAVFALESV